MPLSHTVRTLLAHAGPWRPHDNTLQATHCALRTATLHDTRHTLYTLHTPRHTRRHTRPSVICTLHTRYTTHTTLFTRRTQTNTITYRATFESAPTRHAQRITDNEDGGGARKRQGSLCANLPVEMYRRAPAQSMVPSRSSLIEKGCDHRDGT